MGTALMRRGVGETVTTRRISLLLFESKGVEKDEAGRVVLLNVYACVGKDGGCRGCEEIPVELIIPILTYEIGGVGRKQGRGCWWWRTVAVNSGLINYTSACGNILPKCQSGPCEAAHLTTLAQHVQRSTWWKTHAAKKLH